MRFLPVAPLVAIIWCDTSDETYIEKLFKHSYITLKEQSLDKMSISGGFFQKTGSLAREDRFGTGNGVSGL